MEGFIDDARRPHPRALLLRKRKQDRGAAEERKKDVAEGLKEEGDAHFEHGRYVDAVAKYVEAAKIFGMRPAIMASLAAAYLKLEQYELAEWAADCALFHTPRMAQARFRRGLARKGQHLFKGAELDLQVVVQHHPDIPEAQAELKNVQNEIKKLREDDRNDYTKDQEFPPFDCEEWDLPLESDSEDSKHVGNGKPCRYYNNGGCHRGAFCEYKHASDNESVRDELGQNVCMYFLLGHCKYSKCIYAHTREYLPQGWWSTPGQIQEAKTLRAALDDSYADAQNIENLLNTTAYGRLIKAEEHRKQLELHGAITADILTSRLKKAKQNIVPSGPLSKDSGRYVLLLCLEDEETFTAIHGHFLKALEAIITVVRAKTISQASTYLGSSGLVGVFVTDAGIVRRVNSVVVPQVVKYLERGGSVVFCGLFPSFVTGTDLNQFFSQHFNLPWRYGSYFRTTFHKNAENDLVRRNSSLASSYSMKALHLKGITPESAVYKASNSSHLESLVFGPAPVTNFDEAPAVSARFGHGTISFLGDVNAEDDSTQTLLAMLGPLDDSSIPLSQKPTESESPIAGTGTNKKKKKKKKKKKQADTAGPSSKPEISLEPAQRGGRASDPFIMQLSLGDEEMFFRIHEHQIDALRAKMEVKKATTESQALSLLSSPSLHGVYATDSALAKRAYPQLLTKLVSYVQQGGQLVFGGIFSSFVRPSEVPHLFAAFGCQWSTGSYKRDSLELNWENDIADANELLPETINIKALYLTGINSEDAVYRHSHFASSTGYESPIVHTGIGKGFIGYIGDVNGESCTTTTLLAMLNLLEPQQSTADSLQNKFVIVLGSQADTIHIETTLFKPLQKKGVEVVTDHHLSYPRIADLLSSPDLMGVLALEDIFFEPRLECLGHRIASYVRSGGTAVFGGDAAMVPEFEDYFSEVLHLPWKESSATDLLVQLNRNSALMKKESAAVLEGDVRYMGTFLIDVSPSATVYHSRENLGPERATHVPVAYTNVGSGHIGFVGFSCEDVSELDAKLLLTMLGV